MAWTDNPRFRDVGRVVIGGTGAIRGQGNGRRAAMNLRKMFNQERKEHPWLTFKQAWRIVKDHRKKR